MCVRKSVICLLATTLLCVLMISIDGASIEKSISVSVSTSTSESKSVETKSAIEKASARSLNSAESYEGKVEISAPYARKVINNFSSDDKSRSLKEQRENSTTKVVPITTEKPEIESETTTTTTTTTTKSTTSTSTSTSTTTELNEPSVTSENVVKKIALELNSQIVKERSETTTEQDEPATTVANETTSKKDDATTTVRPEIESSSFQTSSTESSSTESISTESSTNKSTSAENSSVESITKESSSTEASANESNPTESDTTESNSTELSSTETTATDSTETIIETTQINVTSDSGNQTESLGLKESNQSSNDRIVFDDQTDTTTTATIPVIEFRVGTETDKLCDVKVNGECRQPFEQ